MATTPLPRCDVRSPVFEDNDDERDRRVGARAVLRRAQTFFGVWRRERSEGLLHGGNEWPHCSTGSLTDHATQRHQRGRIVRPGQHPGVHAVGARAVCRVCVARAGRTGVYGWHCEVAALPSDPDELAWSPPIDPLADGMAHAPVSFAWLPLALLGTCRLALRTLLPLSAPSPPVARCVAAGCHARQRLVDRGCSRAVTAAPYVRPSNAAWPYHARALVSEPRLAAATVCSAERRGSSGGLSGSYECHDVYPRVLRGQRHAAGPVRERGCRIGGYRRASVATPGRCIGSALTRGHRS